MKNKQGLVIKSMDKRQYLEKILGMCTEGQIQLYNRMYPDGVPDDRVDRAIDQVERTLSILNKKIDELCNVRKEFTAISEKLKTESSESRKTINNLKKEITDLELLNERLSNPISLKNNDIQERLNKLYALEAGGVDNWEWYDQSMINVGL